jgi:hypothetical protein
MRKDTYDEAREKAFAWLKEKKGHNLFNSEARECWEVFWNVGSELHRQNFNYHTPREPQVDDLHTAWDRDELNPVFRRFAGFSDDGRFLDNAGAVWNHHKPTGFRWDSETQTIVPIEEDNND